MRWADIEAALPTLQPASGGYTQATRGLVRLADGRRVFVKIGANENTRAWAAREIDAYGFLAAQGYAHAPKLLAASPDRTGFAIEALCEPDGWTWADDWSPERVGRTLEAMDRLLALDVAALPEAMRAPMLTPALNGWGRLTAAPEQQAALAEKLAGAGAADAVGAIADHLARSAGFVPRNQDLVHLDVRADNCAWRAASGEVGLVDWNWLHLGDRRIDAAATLTMVSLAGFDVLALQAGRLDRDGLHWMAGWWLEAASRPIWPGGPEVLREVQLRAGLKALELWKAVA